MIWATWEKRKSVRLSAASVQNSISLTGVQVAEEFVWVIHNTHPELLLGQV